MKEDSPYIAQMLDCVGQIQQFIGGMSREEFMQSNEKQSAVLMQLLLIGEVAHRVSPAAQREIAIPWPQIIGMRNRVVHEYFDLELENVWKVISEELEPLKAPLEAYLDNHPLKSDGIPA